jgi:hypothetical protein
MRLALALLALGAIVSAEVSGDVEKVSGAVEKSTLENVKRVRLKYHQVRQDSTYMFDVYM